MKTKPQEKPRLPTTASLVNLAAMCASVPAALLKANRAACEKVKGKAQS